MADRIGGMGWYPPFENREVHRAKCPQCGSLVSVSALIMLGELPCPNCGSSLWFFQGADMLKFFDRDSDGEYAYERTIEFLEQKLKLDRGQIVNNPGLTAAVDFESMDIVELVMEIEQLLDHDFGEDDVAS